VISFLYSLVNIIVDRVFISSCHLMVISFEVAEQFRFMFYLYQFIKTNLSSLSRLLSQNNFSFCSGLICSISSILSHDKTQYVLILCCQYYTVNSTLQMA